MWDVLCPQNWTYWIWKDASCCVEMVLTVGRKPPKTSQRRPLRRRSSSEKNSNTLGCWVFARAQCLYLCQNLYFLLKKKAKRNNNKWVCMWVLHAIVLICTGVPKTSVARSPILKKTSSPAALTRYRQPHPKRLYNLIQAQVPGVTCDLWPVGEEGGDGRDLASPLSPHDGHHVRGRVFKLLVNPADTETPTGPEVITNVWH